MIKYKIEKNFIVLLGADIVGKGLSFVVLIYLARVLGAINFGKLSFAQAILAYFLLLADLGVTTAGARELAKNKNNLQHYVNNILGLRFVLSCLSFFLLVLLSIFIPKTYEIKILIISYGFYLFPFSLLLEWVFQGIEDMKYIAVSRILSHIIYFILVISIIKKGLNFSLIPWFWVIGGIAATIFLMLIFNSQFGVPKLCVGVAFLRKFLHSAIPIGASNMLSQVYYNMDTLMLGFMKGSAVVGWYNAAYQVVLGVLGLSLWLTYATFPVLSDTYNDKDRFESVCSHYCRNQVILVCLVIAVGTIFAKHIILLLFGTEYLRAVFVFRILVITLGIILINNVFSTPLLATKFEKDILINTACVAILNMGLNFLLIPKFSLEGASIATFLSESVSLGIVILFYKKRFRQ
ncbi:MAG: flippase [bacterium]|nr:flippase [bacterium]